VDNTAFPVLTKKQQNKLNLSLFGTEVHTVRFNDLQKKLLYMDGNVAELVQEKGITKGGSWNSFLRIYCYCQSRNLHRSKSNTWVQGVCGSFGGVRKVLFLREDVTVLG